ncbi:unnamed protein product [Phytomonas sp. Hart1]|nr:unnamed protein product [Phytomonas sp. Hart1]|eukprot:CCW68355.1 unnamed protein product [Phytomonas sp. isolate Hart1]
MSLSEEIAKLFELHRLGALSAEEFTAAKQMTLNRFSSSAAGAPSSSSSSQLPPPLIAEVNVNTNSGVCESFSSLSLEPEKKPRDADLNDLPDEELTDACQAFPHIHFLPLLNGSSKEDDSREGAFPCSSPSSSSTPHGTLERRERALQHLERIFTNLLSFPGNPKYRQLRPANSILSGEVFAVPGAIPFLRSAGFEWEEVRGKGPPPSHVACNGPPLEGNLLRWHGARECAEEALRAVQFLLERDAASRRRRQGVGKLVRGEVVWEVRLERARAAFAGDPTTNPSSTWVDFLTRLYTADEAGDGLYSSLRNLNMLEAILRCGLKVGEGDAAGKGVLLSLSANPSVYRAVVEQKGALELLLLQLDGELRVGSLSLNFTPSDEVGASPRTNLHQEKEVEEGEVRLAFPFTQIKEGLRTLEEVKRAVKASEAETRKVAVAAMRAEVRRERRRVHHAREQAGNRGVDEVALRSIRRCKSEHSSSSSSRHNINNSTSRSLTPRKGECGKDSPSSGEKKGGSRCRGGKRIPISEALSILLGKTKD